MLTEKLRTIALNTGVDVDNLPDSLCTTYLKAIAENQGADVTKLSDNLLTTYLSAILNACTGDTCEDNLISSYLEKFVQICGEDTTDKLSGTFLQTIVDTLKKDAFTSAYKDNIYSAVLNTTSNTWKYNSGTTSASFRFPIKSNQRYRLWCDTSNDNKTFVIVRFAFTITDDVCTSTKAIPIYAANGTTAGAETSVKPQEAPIYEFTTGKNVKWCVVQVNGNADKEITKSIIRHLHVSEVT